jgi:ATP-binding cassette, subfamily B, bacterial PglK
MKIDKQINIKALLLRLWCQISLRRRKQLILLLLLIVVVSFFEVLTIGAVVPFLGVLTAPDFLVSFPFFSSVIRKFNLNSPQYLLLFFTLLFGCFAIVSGGMRLLMLWASTRLAAGIGHDLSVSIYSKTLYQPYSIHVARNSSELIAGITTKINDVVYGVVSPMLTLLSSVLMLVAILFALVTINSSMALLAFGAFGFIYLIVVRITRGRLAFNSQRIANESVQVVKALQEGVGGIRDVLLDGTQEVYCSVYKEADLTFRQAQAENQFLGGAPRYCIESLGMLVISVLAYQMAQQPAGISAALPLLGSLALGAQRMLPVLQQAYGGWSSIRSTQSSLVGVLELLEREIEF